ncbi:unnamed protein product, partial [marine sediment metagenome]
QDFNTKHGFINLITQATFPLRYAADHYEDIDH